MTGFHTITLETDARGVARLTLNRPERHNALDATMIDELTEVARQLYADPRVRVVVLSGAGKSFCAGADLGWMTRLFEATPDDRTREAVRLAAMLKALDELPKFLIGMIEGAAFGGGLGIAAACDVVLARPEARFALSETRLGLIPATIAPCLTRRIGIAAMRRFGLHGEPFNADVARTIGLVSEVADGATIAALTEHHVAQALACAPGAIADAKRLFRLIAAGQVSDADTVDSLSRRWSTEEAQAGVAAFFSKAKPPWQR